MTVYPIEGNDWWQRLQPLRIPPGWQFLFYKLEPLLEFTSRSTREVVETLERWLFQEFSCGFLDEKEFRRRHLNKR